MYHAESLNVVLKLSIVLADAFKFLLFLTIASVSSDTVVATESKLNVPDPSVTSACPADPSDVGNVYVSYNFTFPVPAGSMFRSAFEPFVVMSLVVTDCKVATP